MSNSSENFRKLFEAVNKIRKEEYADYISEDVLFELLKIQSENLQNDVKESQQDVISLINTFFASKIVK
ncbi:MAG TPA: hypothetical protein GX708_24220 [Gallicola sp.]|nr:hypothetical protein [Gallicola sp.]